jgi:peptidoglycan/xylan/chitin deacetylase (PgdA/CDA1 family)
MSSVARVLPLAAALVALAVPVDAQAHARPGAPDLVAAAPTGPTAPTAPSAAPARAVGDRPCRAGLVALTFDDGPATKTTPRLVRTLRERHVPATFFMVGSRVRRAPRVARRVAAAGFAIGNHTWSHARLTHLPDRVVRREIRSTAHALRRIGIPPGPLMRPPYGEIDPRVRRDVRTLGLVPVLWNVDSEDWRGGSPRRIADSILAQLRRHRDNIVLQHDGVRNSPASVTAVPRVVREARRRGYCFGEIDLHGRVVLPVASADPAAPDPAPRTVPAVGSPFDLVIGRATGRA